MVGYDFNIFNVSACRKCSFPCTKYLPKSLLAYCQFDLRGFVLEKFIETYLHKKCILSTVFKTRSFLYRIQCFNTAAAIQCTKSAKNLSKRNIFLLFIYRTDVSFPKQAKHLDVVCFLWALIITFEIGWASYTLKGEGNKAQHIVYGIKNISCMLNTFRDYFSST